MTKTFKAVPITLKRRLSSVLRPNCIMAIIILFITVTMLCLSVIYIRVDKVNVILSIVCISSLCLLWSTLTIRQDQCSTDEITLTDNTMVATSILKRSKRKITYKINKSDIKSVKYNKIYKMFYIKADVEVKYSAVSFFKSKHNHMFGNNNKLWDYYDDNGYIAEWLGVKK